MADSGILMPGADEAYRQSRDRLRTAEIELRDRIEEVAALRRSLPPGPVVADYEFMEGGKRVALSELFDHGKPYLILYHLMYWPSDGSFCPMCSLWIDGFNGVAPHVTQRANFVIASRAPADKLQAWGARRQWHRLRLLSDDGSAFARAIGAEDADGRPDSTIVVFAKDGGKVRHVYTAHPMLEDRERGIDLLCPVWHLFDLMPSGRDDWYGTNDGFDVFLQQSVDPSKSGWEPRMRATWKPHEKHGRLTKRSDLPSTVYAFPKERKEPLTDARHVRNAIARFDQVTDASDADRGLAFANIKKAAKHYGVELGEEMWHELGVHPLGVTKKRKARPR